MTRDTYAIPRLRRGRNTHDEIHYIKLAITPYQITWDEVCRHTRKREIVVFRQIVQTVLSRNTRLTLHEIGRRVGNKDHATVLNSKRLIECSEFMFQKRGIMTDTLKVYQDIESRFVKLSRGIFKREEY